MKAKNNDTEYLDIVDKNDIVINVKSKDDVYKYNLTHRIVHVLIFNNKNEIALQKRSDKVTFCPLHWSTTVGGHVQTKESYKQAAFRESIEEVGVKLEIRKIGKTYYQANNTPNKFLTIYKTIYDGPFILEDMVEEIKYFSLDQVFKMIDNNEKFHPELIYILNKYFK